MSDFIAKLLVLPQSRRFLVAVIGVLVVTLQETLGLTEEQAAIIGGLLMSWIVGDSIKRTGGPPPIRN